MDIIAYSDSNKSIFEIVEIINIKLSDAIDEINLLKKEKILKTNYI